MADYKKESLSLIVTVLNEASAIVDFLTSVEKQSHLPDQLVIVDGGSSDKTFEILQNFKTKKFKFICIQSKTNRSQGRNLAVNKSKGELIAITDVGCTLDKDWLKELLAKRAATKARVVAGYYQGRAKTKLEQAIIPYFLVMPDQLDEQHFLPATRSMLIERGLWNELGGLNENLNYSEDYLLAKEIEDRGIKIAVAKKALVYWQPPTNFKDFSKTIYLMAKSDVAAGIMRSKVYLIFLRYFIFLLLLLINFNFFLILFSLYILWAVYKNYRYAREAAYYLPILQIVADFSVMLGTSTAKLV